jgi:outer membrane lipoprotein-sorting protein
MKIFNVMRALILFGVLLETSGCGYFLGKTSRTLRPDEKPLPALNATQAELIERFNVISQNTSTLKMKVSFKLTGLDKKKVSQDRELEYYITDGHILIKRPSSIRIIGLLYKITAFDMVSDGKRFSIFVPQKNKLYNGDVNQRLGDVQDLSINLRPQHILQAISMEKLENLSAEDILVENEVDGRKSYYILYILRHTVGGIYFSRKIWFDRYDLNVVRQKLFGENNQMESDISYSDFKQINGHPYPHQIFIKRPQDNFSLQIRVEDIKTNLPLEDERFQLTMPENVERIDLNAVAVKK